MSNKVLVITGTTDIITDHTSGELPFQVVANTTFSSKLNYANKHGYDFLSLNGFGTDKSGKYNPTQIGYLRILRVFNNIENYDYIMWIDADALVTNPNMTIEDFQIDDSIFYCSYDWSGYYSLNTGNFILKNTPQTKLFIDAFYEISKNYDMPEEQATINAMYSIPNLKPAIKVLEHKFLNAVPSVDIVKKDIWGNKPSPPFPWKPDDFLVHATGLPNSERVRIFNECFKNYI
jgi:hypothetical protein